MLKFENPTFLIVKNTIMCKQLNTNLVASLIWMYQNKLVDIF